MTDDPHRRASVIVVTDLVGSTSRRSEMGEEAADAWRRVHDEILGRAIAANDGTVIKGMGDGLMAGFDAATDAVVAAVAIQRAADLHSRRHPHEALDIKIGMSGGDISFEDGDCFGTPVIEAARLCDQAHGGEIYAADIVRLMARGRAGHQFLQVGPLELKGLPEPVDTWLVTWAPSAGDAAATLPAVMAAADRFGFAGRVEARNALRAGYKAALEGSFQIVLITGEPGIGKTRLAFEAAREAHNEGAAVLLGRADEDVQVAFGCVSEALRHLVTHADAATLAEHVRQHGDLLGRLAPDLLERVHDAPPARAYEDERVALLEVAMDLLLRASTVAPIVLVLDDLQWADAASLRLLRHLARHAPPMGVLLIGTYRSTDLSATHPLSAVLGDLQRANNVRRIHLDGLDGGEVAELVAGAAGDDRGSSAQAIAEAVHEETAGNPFFIGEVLVHLADSGVVFRQTERRDGPSILNTIGVPKGVREVIDARISGLTDQANQALRTASVIGVEFDLVVLSAMLDRPVEDVIDLLDGPLDAGLLVEAPGLVDRYRFAHGLIRQTLYQQMAASRRVRLHLRAADAMAATHHCTNAELGYHLCESAAVGDAARAAEVARQVAVEAMGALAYEEAIRWYRQALEADGADPAHDGPRRGRLLVGLARPLKDIGDTAASQACIHEAVALARAAGDVTLLCDAALEYGGGRWRDTVDVTGLALIDEALRALGDRDASRRAELLLRRCEWQYFDPDPTERLEVAAEAISMAKESQLDELLLRALVTRWEGLRGLPGTVEELDTLAPEMVERWRALGSPPRLASALEGATTAAALHGDLHAVAVHTQEHARLATLWRLDTELFHVHAVRACLAMLTGDLDGAGEHIDAAAQHIPADWALGPLIRTRQQAWLAYERGDFAAEREFTMKVREGPPVTRTDLLDAWDAHDQGNPALADERIVLWVRETLPLVPRWLIGHYLGLHSSWAASVGVASAAALYDLLAPFRGQWIAARAEVILGSADLHLGRYARGAGRIDLAVEHFDAAILDHDRAGEVTLRSHAAAELAAVLAERARAGDLERARVLVGEAEHEAARIGLAALAESTRQLRRALEPS